jgi:SAM-dependent methyltransferase
VRVVDLGCGSADGYELLTGVRQREPDLEQTEVGLLTPNVLGLYMGVDLNPDLIDQARAIYGHSPKLQFALADFNDGLPLKDTEKPFDLYFTSYGTCSHHNSDDTAVHMLTEIARRTPRQSLVICDWLGRYSYEWQSLWTLEHENMRNMDYVVSYIYDAYERETMRDQLEHLTLRLMSREEATAIVEEASRRSGVNIRIRGFFDRSIFVGRHMDTAEYNPHAQPIRQAVNSLFEPGVRTDPAALILNYVPKSGFDGLNDYFEHLQMCWNELVYYTAELLDLFDESAHVFRSDPRPIPSNAPLPLANMMRRMRQIVEGVGWLHSGLPRENIIEPQLAFALRQLMMSLQQGLGGGHGFVGILEIDKTGDGAET